MISKDEVLNLAALARLKLEPGEVESLQNDISNILEYVGQVSAVEGVKEKDSAPPAGRQVNHNVMRDDTPRAAQDPLAGKEDALQAAFPKQEGRFNIVRKIIQKDE